RGVKLQQIRARNSHLRAGNRDLCLGKDAIRFAPTKSWFSDTDSNLIAGFVLIIRIKIKLLPTPVTAEGEPNRTSRHVKQVGRVNVKVDRGQRRLRQVFDVCTGKQD